MPTRQTPVKTKDADGSRVRAYLYHFKTDCHVLVYLLRGNSYAVLFSTDTEPDALTHCQARSEAALHSHFNACFTALNLINWHDRQLSPPYISRPSWKAALFIERFSSRFAMGLNLVKSSPAYAGLCNVGALAG
ncbi:MAG: hypothetical protein NTV43_14560 [Methylococcales bacterium]|nr:hypothetical protein [Methylococcales bacterium]